MKNPILARRYAKALYDATEGRADLSVFAPRFAVPEVRTALNRPHLSLKDLCALLGGEPADQAVRNLLSILARRKRAGLLPEIAEIYGLLKEEAQGIRRVEVATAVPLDGRAQQALVSELTKVVKARQVVLQHRVDPELIGGLQVRIGDRLIDGSVSGRLQELRAKF